MKVLTKDQELKIWVRIVKSVNKKIKVDSVLCKHLLSLPALKAKAKYGSDLGYKEVFEKKIGNRRVRFDRKSYEKSFVANNPCWGGGAGSFNNLVKKMKYMSEFFPQHVAFIADRT